MKFVFVPPQDSSILSDVPINEWMTRLQDSVPEVEFFAPVTEEDTLYRIKDADAAFGTLTAEMLQVAKKLRWVQAPAAAPPAGYYSPELIEHPTDVTNFRGIFNDHISAHIIAIILSFSQHLNLYRDQQNARNWNKLSPPTHHSIFLPESEALIVGLGGIGNETARLCAALGIKVRAVDARRHNKPDWVTDLNPPDTLEQLLPSADFVIVTIPHTPLTRGLFDMTKFSLMKNTAIFVNIGRGLTTKLDDLVKALETGEIAGAGLDVYEIEPLPKKHPLWAMQNAILTPHIAAQSGSHLNDRKYEIILENTRNLINGTPLKNLVDKKYWY